MCQTCGAIHPTRDDLLICKNCHNTSCSMYEKRDASCSSNANFLLQHCKPCSEKHGNEVLTMEDSSPYTTPLLSPMSSFGSFFSSYGKVFRVIYFSLFRFALLLDRFSCILFYSGYCLLFFEGTSDIQIFTFSGDFHPDMNLLSR